MTREEIESIMGTPVIPCPLSDDVFFFMLYQINFWHREANRLNAEIDRLRAENAELLAACKAVAADVPLYTQLSWLRQLDAAIAKAEGRS